MTREDTIGMTIGALLAFFAAGAMFGSWVTQKHEPTVIHITEHQRRRLCMAEQRAVVSTWRRWTEKAAAAGECRAYVLRGDEP